MHRCHGQPSTLAIACFEALVGVRDAQPDARQPAGAQAAQELAPERLGLGLTDVDADDLPAAGLVHAIGDHQRLVAHPAGLADPLDLGVQPQVRVGALQGPLTEHPDLLVQAAAQPRHLVLGQVVQAQLLDQPVDLAGGHPVDVGLLHDGDQGLFGPPARLQEAGEVGALAQPGIASSSSPTRVSHLRGR